MLPQIEMVRKAIESLYDCKARIWNFEEITNSKTGGKRQNMIEVTSEPILCRISFQNLTHNDAQVGADEITQVTKIFMSPDVVVKEGSQILVEFRNRISEYVASGVPAVYDSHQEIIVISKKRHP